MKEQDQHRQHSKGWTLSFALFFFLSFQDRKKGRLKTCGCLITMLEHDITKHLSRRVSPCAKR